MSNPDEKKDRNVNVFGLVMTPVACGLGVWRRDGYSGDTTFLGQERTRLADAFEIRAFCEQWELRWIREGRGGVATLMSEDSSRLSGWTDLKVIALAGETLERRYLLWGEVDDVEPPSDGWLRLRSNRTGSVPVPFRSVHRSAGNRIQLVAKEYLARFEHGNVCVFDQRLTKLIRTSDGRTEDATHG